MMFGCRFWTGLAVVAGFCLASSCTQQKVVVCKPTEGFDPKTGKCYPCPEGTKVDKKTASCVPILEWEVSEGSDWSNVPDVSNKPDISGEWGLPEGGDLLDGLVESELVILPAGLVGAACTTASDCLEGGLCLDWPEGYCIIPDCTCDETCPEGSWCLPLLENMQGCFDACESDKECRAGYGCKAIPKLDGHSKKVCHPVAPGGKGVGGKCVKHEECAGELACVKLGSASMCTVTGCGPFDPCPKGAVCIEWGETALCMLECASDQDCKVISGGDFTCQEGKKVEGGSASVCCPVKKGLEIGELCQFGTECSTGVCYPIISGRCSGPQGTLCGSDAECDEGICVPDPSVQKGVCSKECSAGDPCPTGNWCVVGSHKDTYCVPNCTNKGGECGPEGMGMKCTYGPIFYPPSASMYGCVKTHPGQAGTPCDADGNCLNGGICYGSVEGKHKGWCATPCVTAKDCPFGSECQNGTIVPGKMYCAKVCLSDLDCPEGFACLNVAANEKVCLVK